MDIFLKLFFLFVLLFTVVFLIWFSVRFIQEKKKAEKNESILEGLRSCSSESEVSAYLKTLSFDDLKFVCDWYHIDLNNFIKKV